MRKKYTLNEFVETINEAKALNDVLEDFGFELVIVPVDPTKNQPAKNQTKRRRTYQPPKGKSGYDVYWKTIDAIAEGENISRNVAIVKYQQFKDKYKPQINGVSPKPKRKRNIDTAKASQHMVDYWATITEIAEMYKVSKPEARKIYNEKSKLA